MPRIQIKMWHVDKRFQLSVVIHFSAKIKSWFLIYVLGFSLVPCVEKDSLWSLKVDLLNQIGPFLSLAC